MFFLPPPRLRPRITSRSSDQFYCTVDPADTNIVSSNQDGVKRYNTKQSRRLPHWAWYIIAKSLGIKLHPADKPYLGTVLHALTVGLAILYVLMFTWYTVFDIVSRYTKSTVLTGLVAIIIVIYWSSLGVYGNRLAAKLFASETFLSSVRMHSRTLFKISAVGIMTIVAVLALGLNNYEAVVRYSGQHCRNVSVSYAVCTTMVVARCSYSLVCMLWNVLVGLVLLSVCRTHTIGT